MGPLNFLAADLPRWITFPSIRGDRILGFATPIGTVWERRPLDVTIFTKGEVALARETRRGDRLPAWCPERHLNADGSFCLGLDHLVISSSALARQWWADLEVHLRLQSVAERTMVWPGHSALDHGDAGRFHSAARRLAFRLGLSEDYERALAGDESWITDINMELVGPDGELRNCQAPCPCGCVDSQQKPRTRRRCRQRSEISKLILLERARRLALSDFWEKVRATRTHCCGSMRDCPLAGSQPGEGEHGSLNRTRRALQRCRF